MPLGGMSIPMTPALASIAATRPRGYFFSLSIGPMMPPIAEKSCGGAAGDSGEDRAGYDADDGEAASFAPDETARGIDDLSADAAVGHDG